VSFNFLQVNFADFCKETQAWSAAPLFWSAGQFPAFVYIIK
jgi:hypothetical protein